MPRILIVDDEPDIVLTLRMICELEGFQVLAAGSAEEALDILEVDTPDAVVLDIGLPGADGWWFLDQITNRRLYPPSNVVVVTAHVSPASPTRALQYGARYVAKPFRAEDVLSAVGAAAAR